MGPELKFWILANSSSNTLATTQNPLTSCQRVSHVQAPLAFSSQYAHSTLHRAPWLYSSISLYSFLAFSVNQIALGNTSCRCSRNAFKIQSILLFPFLMEIEPWSCTFQQIPSHLLAISHTLAYTNSLSHTFPWSCCNECAPRPLRFCLISFALMEPYRSSRTDFSSTRLTVTRHDGYCLTDSWPADLNWDLITRLNSYRFPCCCHYWWLCTRG